MSVVGHVAALWRYPVKSMAGETLDSAELTEDGVAGDRIIQVRNAAGRIMTAASMRISIKRAAECPKNRTDPRPASGALDIPDTQASWA